MTNSNRFSRRRFISTATKGLAVIPAISVLETSVWAAELISEDHPTAKALGYFHDANAVDTAKFPKRAAPEAQTQFCDNCMHYTAVEGDTGTCALLPGFVVKAKGWCNVWVAKPS